MVGIERLDPGDVTIYPDAGHAFMNPGNTAGYREKDAEDAWGRITAFFRKKFKQ